MFGKSLSFSIPLLFVALTTLAAAQDTSVKFDEQSYVDEKRGISLQVGKELKLLVPTAKQREDSELSSVIYELFSVEWRARGSADDLANPVFYAIAMKLAKDTPRTPLEYLTDCEKRFDATPNFVGWPYEKPKLETVGGVAYAVTHTVGEPTPNNGEFLRTYITIRGDEAIWYSLRCQTDADLADLEKVFRAVKHVGK